MSTTSKVEVIRAACCIAGIDGRISEIEQKIIKAFADEVGVGEMSLQAMMDRAENDADFYREQFRILKDDPLQTIQFLLAIALADGSFPEQEQAVLQAFAGELGLSSAEFDRLLGEADDYLNSRSDG